MKWAYRKGAWDSWKYTSDPKEAEQKHKQGYEVVWKGFEK